VQGREKNVFLHRVGHALVVFHDPLDLFPHVRHVRRQQSAQAESDSLLGAERRALVEPGIVEQIQSFEGDGQGCGRVGVPDVEITLRHHCVLLSVLLMHR
jgi:hypothetical protein